MNLLPVDIVQYLWAGYGAFCILIATLSLFRVSWVRAMNAKWPLFTVVGGGVVFVLSLLSNFGPIDVQPFQWVYSSGQEVALQLAARIDYLSGWFLGLTVLILTPLMLRGRGQGYLSTGIAFAIPGVLLSWTAESVWTAMIGWVVLCAAGLLIRLGAVATDLSASRFFSKDVLRSGIFVLLLWVSAIGLETLGFKWNFGEIPEKGMLPDLFLGIFFFAMSGFALPWIDPSSSFRGPESEETEALLFSGILLPVSVAGSVFRWTENLEGSVWSTIAGIWIVALGLLFFLLYLASKNEVERHRALSMLYGSIALSSTLLFPSWTALLLSLGLGAVLSMVITGFRGIPQGSRKVFLFFVLAAVAGIPGFLPSLLLHRSWLDLVRNPIECGGFLLLHGFFLVASAREIGVRFFAPETDVDAKTDLGKLVPYALLFIFTLVPWTTGSWTGGVLDQSIDEIAPFQGAPWVAENDLRMVDSRTGPVFLEGRWVQFAIATLGMFLLLLFREGRDPFLTRETSWQGFRSVMAKDAGLAWLGDRMMVALGRIGWFVDTRLLSPVWEKGLPTLGKKLGAARHFVSRRIELWSEAVTGERWNFVVSAPSYLIQAMTNGRSNWYLFFTILVTFLLVLHFIVKIS